GNQRTDTLDHAPRHAPGAFGQRPPRSAGRPPDLRLGPRLRLRDGLRGSRCPRPGPPGPLRPAGLRGGFLGYGVRGATVRGEQLGYGRRRYRRPRRHPGRRPVLWHRGPLRPPRRHHRRRLRRRVPPAPRADALRGRSATGQERQGRALGLAKELTRRGRSPRRLPVQRRGPGNPWSTQRDRLRYSAVRV
ncbi:MAG: probable membrane protein NMA1128, partial [uncultured Rubrobacteraceae bacterium]